VPSIVIFFPKYLFDITNYHNFPIFLLFQTRSSLASFSPVANNFWWPQGGKNPVDDASLFFLPVSVPFPFPKTTDQLVATK
jgi:hypothetical protein